MSCQSFEYLPDPPANDQNPISLDKLFSQAASFKKLDQITIFYRAKSAAPETGWKPRRGIVVVPPNSTEKHALIKWEDDPDHNTSFPEDTDPYPPVYGLAVVSPSRGVSFTSTDCKGSRTTESLSDGVWCLGAVGDHSVLVGDANGGVTRFDILGGNVKMPSLGNAKKYVTKHSQAICGLRVNAAQTVAVTISLDSVVCVWDTITHALRTRHQGGALELNAVDIHPFRDIIVAAAAHSTVYYFTSEYSGETTLGEPRHISTQSSVTERPACTALRYSQDGMMLAVGHEDGLVIMLDATSWEPIGKYPASAKFSVPVRDVVCPNASTVAALFASGNVLVFHKGRQDAFQPDVISPSVTAIVYDFTRNLLWCSVEKRRVPIRLESRKATRVEGVKVLGESDKVVYQCMALSPNGEVFFGGSDDLKNILTVASFMQGVE